MEPTKKTEERTQRVFPTKEELMKMYEPLTKVDFSVLRELEANKFITIKESNPEYKEKLYVLNYTEICAFAREWNQITLQCRGLIVNEDGDVIARPFPKFFNFEEPEAIIPQNEDFVVSYKEDGSCGILYYIDGKARISTRGSLNSDQATKATDLLHNKYGHLVDSLDKDYTYIFEIIYPENRIVLDYGDREDIILLGKIHTETGKDVSSENMEQDLFPTRRVFKNASSNLADLKLVNETNIEGFVVHWPKSNVRVKVKMEEYKRLHKIMTGLSEKGIWEMLRENQDLSLYLKNVPDEFFNWFNGVCDNLRGQFNELLERAKVVCEEVKKVSDGIEDPKEKRKVQAIFINQNAKDIAGIVFNLLDNGEYESNIWQRLRPKAETFKKDIDA